VLNFDAESDLDPTEVGEKRKNSERVDLRTGLSFLFIFILLLVGNRKYSLRIISYFII
jgi:hypothetical protein